MNNTLRQEKILDLLSTCESKTVAELAQILNVTMMTIRRDLEVLQQKELITKAHGYAMLVRKEMSLQPSFQERAVENKEQKQRIAKKAAELIEKDSIVCFDAGTTSLEITDFLPNDIKFTAITTGLITATRLCSFENVDVINVGGNVHKSSYSMSDYIAVDNLQKFKADIAFITTKGFSFPEGAYEARLPLIEVKRAIVKNSKKVVLLADSSKFESASLSLSVPLSDIDMIITDSGIDSKLADKIRSKNIILEIV